ncbi:MAG: SsrA-binding protein SmpB [Deltaproteobacteria bacterium]|nr:SsrA-binding protein SmpB [Deltaproteobacteria bacterium]MBI3296147.1 SsrA-binding protein SmpB [Deltaproteobacteria bacterium]
MAGIKIICDNRNAFHNYSFEERWEAGLVLLGTEVKALRDGKANLRDAYALLKHGELWLLNAHISLYAHGNRENHEPLRSRKLLLHREELAKLWSKLQIRGYSLIPLKLYFKDGVAKAELGLGKAKKLHDKRAATKERDEKRTMDRLKRMK